MAEKKEQKTVELWEGYEVPVNETLFKDVDFLVELNDAQRSQDLGKVINMSMAVVGGEKTYQDAKEHIIAEDGFFSTDGFDPILKKIADLFPKDGNRQSRRWESTSR